MNLSPWPSKAYRHKGARNPSAKINLEMVQMIRTSDLGTKALAKKLHLNPGHVSEIRHGKRWKES